MDKSESLKELATALAKAQAEIENAHKTSNNPHFKSKYADLAEVINTVRPVFSAHGLSVTQMPSFEAGIASVETLLLHASGEWISSVSSAPVSKQDAQGVGSAITYLRRYSLAAIAGVAQEDDDGNAAVAQAKPKAQKETPAMDAAKTLAQSMAKATTTETLDQLYSMASEIQGLPQTASDRLATIYNERTAALGG